MVCVGTVSLLSWEYLHPGARKIKHIKVYMSKGEGVTVKTPRNMVCSWQHWCGDPLFCCVTYVDHTELIAGSFCSVSHHCLHTVLVYSIVQFICAVIVC